ncbi:MAG: excinuclease ABC subunit UvrC [Rickettsiaceae bacterium H1]|nr:excinuclease ABC subunit UvrC [Rickettsiaceae bacterium H1]
MFDSHRDHHLPFVMSKAIKYFLQNAPDKPGIYKMFDSKGDILYVGKAKNLKNRIKQYLQPLTDRLLKMVIQVRDLSVTITNNEVEALILESKLIKKLQPKYNILLKDDKSYPYIRLTQNHEFPRLTKYRGKYQKGCYGPFPSTEKLYNMISVLHKVFQLRSCSDQNFANRKRHCLEYQIKRCSAPCVGKISLNDYKRSVKQAKSLLKGKKNNVWNELKRLMEEASKNLDYELASVYRDKMNSIRYLDLNQQNIENGDVIAIYRDGNLAHIQILSFSDSSLHNRYFYTMSNVSDNDDSKVMEAFIMQFYQDLIPNNIISNYPVSNTTIIAVKKIFGKEITFHQPKKGKKQQILQDLYSTVKKNFYINNTRYFLNLVKEKFLLEVTPQRIEIYDNSHISGDCAIGVMVVIDSSGFNKNQYRRFNLSNIISDDYFMMKEVLTRRMNNDIKEKPDFILIDGGKGHMSVVKDVLRGIPFACISKGEKRNSGDETFHTLEFGSFKLEKNSTLLYFLQRIRDEAHRFAISSHRVKRNKSIKKSLLDEIPGIGNKRKKLLLTHFGSVAEIKQATIRQLADIDGISMKLAELIFTHFDQS